MITNNYLDTSIRVQCHQTEIFSMSLSEDWKVSVMLLRLLDFVARLNDPQMNPKRFLQEFLKASVRFVLSFLYKLFLKLKMGIIFLHYQILKAKLNKFPLTLWRIKLNPPPSYLWFLCYTHTRAHTHTHVSIHTHMENDLTIFPVNLSKGLTFLPGSIKAHRIWALISQFKPNFSCGGWSLIPWKKRKIFKFGNV